MQLAKDAIDLGIVITDSDASMAFYRDRLGLEHEGDIPMPLGGGGVMHRLHAGSTLVKLVRFDTEPEAKAPGGGIPGGVGLRYFTFTVTDIEGLVGELEAAGDKVIVPVTDLRPGIRIAIVADPDGNNVEFLQLTS